MHTTSFLRIRFRTLILLTMVFLVSSSQAQQGKLFKKQYIKSTMVKVASWQFVHPNGKPENTWTNGAFYTGFYAAYETTQSKLLYDSCLRIHLEHFQDRFQRRQIHYRLTTLLMEEFHYFFWCIFQFA